MKGKSAQCIGDKKKERKGGIKFPGPHINGKSKNNKHKGVRHGKNR